MIKMKIIEHGLGPNLLDKDAVAKLVKAALPHYEPLIAKHGDAIYHHLLDELEQRLLDELRHILSGEEADTASVERAAEINRISSEMLEKDKRSSIPA